MGARLVVPRGMAMMKSAAPTIHPRDSYAKSRFEERRAGKVLREAPVYFPFPAQRDVLASFHIGLDLRMRLEAIWHMRDPLEQPHERAHRDRRVSFCGPRDLVVRRGHLILRAHGAAKGHVP